VIAGILFRSPMSVLDPHNGHNSDIAHEFEKCHTGIRTVCVFRLASFTRSSTGMVSQRRAATMSFCCTFSGTLFISIYRHISVVDFLTGRRVPIPENACAERAESRFRGDIQLRLRLFCVDGMKIPVTA